MSLPILNSAKEQVLLAALEREIAALENELKEVENKINAFQTQIRTALHLEIARIRELTQLYKQKKEAKKAQRLAQKKRGKNYKEPVAVEKTSKALTTEIQLNKEDQQELKRLYKEAISVVHPDKFAANSAEQMEKAGNLTQELIDIYQDGDLDKLSLFHEHIISGNAMSHEPFQTNTVLKESAMIAFLQNKKEELSKALNSTLTSPIYLEQQKHEDYNTYIIALKTYFDNRIQLLEKRTKKLK